MLSPLPRRSGWAYQLCSFTQPYQPSPKGLSGRPAHRPFRGLHGVHLRYGLHTRAATVFRDTLSEGFSYFVTSIAAPVASGWGRRRVGLAPTGKAPPFHGATRCGLGSTLSRSRAVDNTPPAPAPSLPCVFVGAFRHGRLAEGRACSAGFNPAPRGTVAALMRSDEIEPVQVHHLVPSCHEVFHKLLF
jgi:hypothetical protein